MIGIRLQQNMECEYICQQAQLLISRYIRDNGAKDNLMLVLDIKEIIDGNIAPIIQNLEDKSENS